MSYVTFGKYSINGEFILESTFDELCDRFPNYPNNVLVAAWESVHGKQKKPKKKPKTDNEQ
jgi:hypothetical protein